MHKNHTSLVSPQGALAFLETMGVAAKLDSLLKCRALEGWQCWRSLSACAAQGWVSTVSSSVLTPAATDWDRGLEHSSRMFLVTGTIFPLPWP